MPLYCLQTSEVSFRRSEFSRGISLREFVQEEEIKSALAQENVICFNNVGTELTALDAQISRFVKDRQFSFLNIIG